MMIEAAVDVVAGDPLDVVLADPQALFRESVRIALTADPGFRVVGEARDREQAVARVVEASPHVIVVDAEIAGDTGVVAAIRERMPSCKVLVVSAQDDAEVLVAAIEAGASGYLSKEAPLVDLISAMRTVCAGGTVVQPAMLSRLLMTLLARRDDRDEAFRRLARLTPRERQVMALIAEGADKFAIAAQLVISPHTARTHVQNVLAKLGVHSRLEATAFIVRTGVVRELETLVESDGSGLRSVG